MMDEELIKIWQSSPNQERIKFEKSRLMIEMQSSIDHFHRRIKYRDLGEFIGMAIGMPAYAYFAYSVPNLVSKIAAFFIVCWGVYVFFRLRNAKKHKPVALNESYLGYLHKMKDYLLIQKQLLDNVLYWYILPALALVMMFVMGFGIVGRVRSIINMALFGTGMGAAIYFLNKRAVKKQFVPRLAKIEELIYLTEQE